MPDGSCRRLLPHETKAVAPLRRRHPSGFLIDTHCHLHDKEFFAAEEAEKCITRAHEAGVEKIICIGTSHEDSLQAREFAARHENVYWTYGVHPEEAALKSESIFSSAGLENPGTSYTGQPGEPPASRANLSTEGRPLGVASIRNASVPSTRLLQRSGSSGIYVPGFSNHFMLQKKQDSDFKNPVAIGEVGLDYHYEDYDREAQIRLFEQMLQLATDNNLPVSFHVREAFEDFFPIIANFSRITGVVHSFTDSKKVLKRLLNETEFLIGVNGLATYSTLPTPPLERILLETDAPFLTPVPHRGKPNEPAYIADIAKWLAKKLAITDAEVARVTTSNAVQLFGLDS